MSCLLMVRQAVIFWLHNKVMKLLPSKVSSVVKWWFCSVKLRWSAAKASECGRQLIAGLNFTTETSQSSVLLLDFSKSPFLLEPLQPHQAKHWKSVSTPQTGTDDTTRTRSQTKQRLEKEGRIRFPLDCLQGGRTTVYNFGHRDVTSGCFQLLCRYLIAKIFSLVSVSLALHSSLLLLVSHLCLRVNWASIKLLCWGDTMKS